MSGLLFLIIIVMWTVVTIGLAAFISVKAPRGWWSVPLGFVLFLALFPLPVVDELLAKPEFKRMCEANSVVHVDQAKAAGRTVYLAEVPFEEVRGTWVRAVRRPYRFVDAQTGEVVVSYDILNAAGGWFVQAFPLSEGRVPLLFKGSCVPPNRPVTANAFKQWGVNYVERPNK